jgi:phosphoribosylamine--glycine ligase
MKIAILGNSASTDFIVQTMLKCNKVETMYHLGAPINSLKTDRYIPISLFYSDITVEKNKEFILEFPYKNIVDLILPMNNQYQLWTEFYNKMKNSKAAVLMSNRQVGMLEWSKIIGKKFLKEAGIPTSVSKEYNLQELIKEFLNIPRPFVLKYDQYWREELVGKNFLEGSNPKSPTIIITNENYKEEFDLLKKETTDLLTTKFFENQKFLIEEYIDGIREFSYHALMNDTSWTYLGCARDYKKRYENDQGYNTAGMGSYSPVTDVNPIIHSYIDRLRKLLKEKRISYIGFLYLGIIIDKNGTPIVLEINTRPGCPEIQSILSVIDDNIVDLFYKAATNQELKPVKFSNKSAVSIRIINKEYNLDLRKNNIIQFPELYPPIENICIQYNTQQNSLSSVITTTADNIDLASDNLYAFLKNKNMGNFTYRKDIGYLR